MRCEGFLAGAALAAMIAGAGCVTSTHGRGPSPFPRPGGARAGLPPIAAGPVAAALASGLTGAPYRFGGDSPDGFDCSGLVFYAYRQAGLLTPRTVRDLYDASESIHPDEMLPGDLVFFRNRWRRVNHVGIALGDGTFVHAPSSRGVVRIERLDTEYWMGRFADVRRLLVASDVEP